MLWPQSQWGEPRHANELRVADSSKHSPQLYTNSTCNKSIRSSRHSILSKITCLRSVLHVLLCGELAFCKAYACEFAGLLALPMTPIMGESIRWTKGKEKCLDFIEWVGRHVVFLLIHSAPFVSQSRKAWSWRACWKSVSSLARRMDAVSCKYVQQQIIRWKWSLGVFEEEWIGWKGDFRKGS